MQRMFGYVAAVIALGAAPVSAAAPPVCGPAATVLHAEGAPTDLVVLRNISDGPWDVAVATIDLDGSVGRLIFDTVSNGAGTNVAQPFRVAGGEAVLRQTPEIPDGSESLSLIFDSFPRGTLFRFTIDLDDQVTALPGATVAEAETAGATFSATFRHADGRTETHRGTFNDRGGARAAAPCVS